MESNPNSNEEEEVSRREEQDVEFSASSTRIASGNGDRLSETEGQGEEEAGRQTDHQQGQREEQASTTTGQDLSSPSRQSKKKEEKSNNKQKEKEKGKVRGRGGLLAQSFQDLQAKKRAFLGEEEEEQQKQQHQQHKQQQSIASPTDRKSNNGNKRTPVRGLSNSMEDILRKRMAFMGGSGPNPKSNKHQHTTGIIHHTNPAPMTALTPTNPPTKRVRKKQNRQQKQTVRVGRIKNHQNRNTNVFSGNRNSTGSSQLGLSTKSLEDIIQKRMVFSGEVTTTTTTIPPFDFDSADNSSSTTPTSRTRRGRTRRGGKRPDHRDGGTTNPSITETKEEEEEEEAENMVEVEESEEFDILNHVARKRQARERRRIPHVNNLSGNAPPPPIPDEVIPPPLSYQRTLDVIAAMPREPPPPGAYARAPGMASVRMDADAILSLQRQQEEEEEIQVPTEDDEERQEIASDSLIEEISSSSAASQASHGEQSSTNREEEVEEVDPPIIEAFLVGHSQTALLPPSNLELDQAERGGQEQPTMRTTSPQSSNRQEVPLEDTIEVVVAQKVNLLDLLQNGSIQLFIAILLAIVVSISIGSSIVIVLSRPDSNMDNTTPVGTLPPAPAVEEYLVDPILFEELPDFSQSRINTPRETTADIPSGQLTPQTKAFQWLSRHPDLVTMNKEQRLQTFAMSTFFYSFNGDDWKDEEGPSSRLLQQQTKDSSSFWNNVALHVCKWGWGEDEKSAFPAFVICNEDNKIETLQVNRFIQNFNGVAIPPEITLLTDLQELVIQRNNLPVELGSFIPTELKDLNLTKVRFGRNGLKGNIDAIKSTLFSIKSLQFLDISWNKLSGSLPEIYPINLVSLDLRHNSLTSTIPTSLESLPYIESVYLQDNSLTGTIHGSMCIETAIEHYDVNHEPELRVDSDKVICNATCCSYGIQPYLQLPTYTLQSLDNPNSPQAEAYSWLEDRFDRRILREHLELWERQQLLSLATFYYSFNGPAWPDALRGHEVEWLDEDYHECNWGKDWGAIDQTFHGNWCRGSQRNSFKILDILNPPGGNRFILAGSMPPQVSLLTNLEQIVICTESTLDSSLVDMMPTQLAEMPRLTDLNYAKNRLNGQIPPSVGNLTNLDFLTLHNNELTGTLPSELGSLMNLKSLELQNNKLSGSIPTQVGRLTLLSSLLLAGGNPFTPDPNPEEYEARYQNSEQNIDPTLLAEFVKQASGKAMMPLEICNLTSFNLKTLQVDCSVVACPSWCNCKCSG